MSKNAILAGALGGCMVSLCLGCAPPAEEKRPTRPDVPASASESATGNSTSTGDAAAAAAPDANAPAGEVKVQLASHAELMERVAKAKGKVVVVDVWSTSCLPCMKEYPNLVALSKRFPEDVECISFNVDYLGLPKKTAEQCVPEVQKFLEAQKSTLTNFVSTDPDSDVLEKFDVEAMPAIMIYDRQGALVAKLTDDSAGEGGLSYQKNVLPLVESLARVRPAQQ